METQIFHSNNMITYIKNLFGFSTIKSEIMKMLNSRIAQAENDFKAGVKEINEVLEYDIKEAISKSELDTKLLIKNLVKKVVSDLID